MKTYAIYGFGITLANAILMLLLLAAGFLTNANKLGTGFLILMPCILIISIVGIILATKAARAEAGNKGFSYGKAWVTALFTMVAAALFGTAFNFVYYKFINPNYNEVAIEWVRTMMENSGASSAKIDEKVEEMREKGTISKQLTNGVLYTVIFGAVVGLITAGVMKRAPVEDLTQASPPPLG